MEYRFMQDEDKEKVKRMWNYCFDDPQPFVDWYFRDYYRAENTLGIFQGENLLSSLQLIPYEIYLRGSSHPSAYIVGLASSPEARGRGLIKELLKTSLKEMRKRNCPISLLMPFQAQFYYPYQWEFCYHHFLYRISLEDLREIGESYGEWREIKELDDEIIESLALVYSAFVKDKHGFVKRSSTNWKLIWGELQVEKGFAYLLIDRGKPVGYIFYYLKSDKIVVKEMAYTGFRAQKSLFRFLYNHRSQVEFLEWHAPVDDATHFMLPDPKIGVSLYPFLTARIVDVEKILTLINYPPEATGEVIIGVNDSLAGWNNQTFYLQVHNRKGKVWVTDRKPQVMLGIGALTQLVFGVLSAPKLVFQEKISVENLQILQFIDKLFPQCNNYINEYY